MHQFSYDPQRGSFRSWLFKVTQNALRKKLRRRNHIVAGTGQTTQQVDLAESLDQKDAEEAWITEYDRRLFEWAVQRALDALARRTLFDLE